MAPSPTPYIQVEAGDHTVGGGLTQVWVKVYAKPGYTLPEGFRLHPESADADQIGEHYVAHSINSMEGQDAFSWLDFTIPVTPEPPIRTEDNILIIPESDQVGYLYNIVDPPPLDIPFIEAGEGEIGPEPTIIRIVALPGFELSPVDEALYDYDHNKHFFEYRSNGSGEPFTKNLPPT